VREGDIAVSENLGQLHAQIRKTFQTWRTDSFASSQPTTRG
jgi:hypothetical protein